ncbi:tetratricopeptide repeat protein [Desulfococcaceae bacterium HSG9]|nr:tetratricopeptide repeat protein [Desulfococcaceae bacterium HSG9]
MNLIKRLVNLGRNEQYEEAIRYYEKCHYKKAINLFNEVLRLKKGKSSPLYTLAKFHCTQAHQHLGKFFMVSSHYQDASLEFEKALELKPDCSEMNQYLGICYTNLNQPAKAYAAFEKILQQDHDRLSPKFRLSIIFFNLGIWDKARNAFSVMIQRNPELADIHYHLGLVNSGLCRAKEAIKAYEKALTINPNYIKARIKCSILYAYRGKLDDALDTMLPVVQKHPSFADAHYLLGLIYAARNETTQSIEHLKQAISINPDYKDAHTRLGFLLLDSGVRLEALDEFKKAIRICPDDNPLLTALKIYDTIGDTSEYHSWEQELFCEGPDDEKAPLSDKRQDLMNYFIISPGFAEMLSILKMLPQDIAFFHEELIPFLEEILAIHPDYSDVHNSLGTFYLKIGLFDKAIASFQSAHKISPCYLKARVNLFNALKEQGDLEAALKEGQKLFDDQLSYPDILLAMGEVYLAQGRFEEAQNITRRALAQNDKYGPAQFLSAQILHKSGRPDEAYEALRKCVYMDFSH